jgi:hypothetical protein
LGRLFKVFNAPLVRVRRYRDVIFHSLIGVGIHAFILFILAPHSAQKYQWATLGLIVWLQLALLFNQKRLFNTRLGVLGDILERHYGFSLDNNQYNMRARHFRSEKQKLAEILIRDVLPHVIQTARQTKFTNFQKVNIFLDSGTTITPAFKPLLLYGLPLNTDQFTIYTNNLAGIDEIHKLPAEELEQCRISEEKFNLLPGLPLSKYRATTEGGMDRFLEELWREQKDSAGRIFTISIITANWVLGGPGLDSLQLCARGRGHLEFKEKLVEHSDYVILVAPLAKLLRVDDVQVLNNLTAEADYRSYPLPKEKKKATFLLTSCRPHHSLSPFRNLTLELNNLHERDGGENYMLWPNCPEFMPLGDYNEVISVECPHKYVRDSFEKIYGFSP